MLTPHTASSVLAAWRLQRAGRHVEALSRLERAGLRSGLRLRSLFALELHQAFLDELTTPRGWQIAARGLARLALGDTSAAADDLATATARPARFGLWLRAASALALIDPGRLRVALEPRQREAPAAILLAHLAERAGARDRAIGLLDGLRLSARWTAEADLLRANLGDDIAVARVFPGEDEAAVSGGPLVSVIVAAHDAASTIEAALRSLLAQSWRDLEVLLVDDASTDDTAARAAAIEGVRVIRQARNEGAYVARNAGLAAARGAFLAFHDADDVARPERIAAQMAPLLRDPELAFTTARWVRRDSEGRFRARQIVPLIRRHVGSMLIRRTALDTVGNFDPVRYGADGDLLLRLELAAGPRGHAELTQPLTIGGFDPASAVHDLVTGYGTAGFSLARQAYREMRTWALIEQLARCR